MSPQEEFNFQWVLARMRSLNDLNPPPPKVDRKQRAGISKFVDFRQTETSFFALPRSGLMANRIDDSNGRLALDRDCFRETWQTKVPSSAPG